MNFSEWLTQVSGDATQVEISDHTGIPRRTIQYQISKGEKLDTVIQISEAYESNPITALISLGHIKEHWLRALAGDTDAALMSADEERLAGEVLRRLKEAKKKTALDLPLDELAARRSNGDTPNVQPLTEDEEAALIEEANQLRGAAHPRTPRLDEPEDP